MKNRLIKGILVFGLMVLALPAPSAFAEPYISITSTGGTSASISVSGAPYGQSIDLVYTLPGSSLPTVISNIGNAYSGTWNGTLNLNEYGIVNGSSVYVRVGGQQSNTIIVGGYIGGCTYNCGNPYTLSLSQNNVNLTVGQSQTVSAYPSTGSGPYGGTGSIYISSNSNPSVVSAAVNSGNQIGLYGLMNGSSTISVCTNNYSYGSTQNCASIYVTVGGSVAGTGNTSVSIRDNFYSPQTITISTGSSVTWRNDGSMSHTVTFDSPYSDSGTVSYGNSYTKTFNTAGTYTYHCNFHSGMTGTVIVTGSGSGTGNVWFSPSNPTMSVGQSLAVSVNSSVGTSGSYYGSSAYYVSSNSNPNVVSASINGTVLNLVANQSGSSSLNVCHSSLSFCSTLYVTVSGGTVGNITFSPSNPNLTVGQNLTVAVNAPYVYSGSFYISSNSNPSVVSASISGNTINLYGLASGNSTLMVCQSGSGSTCGSLYVTVSGTSGSGLLTFSENNINLSTGQSRTVTVYNSSSYSSGYYVSSNSNPSAVSASVSGSQVYVYAQNSGSATINVCLSGNPAFCGSLYINSGGGGSGGSITFSPSNPSVGLSQSMTVSIYGASSNDYYISSNSNPNTVTASVSGSNLYLYGKNYGSSSIIICQNGYSACGTLFVNVGGGSYGGNLSLSQTNLSLAPYQSATVTVYGSGSYYISSNTTPSVASASVTGSTVNIYAYVSGSTTVNVCQSYNSQCAALIVNVGGAGYSGDIRITNTSLPTMVLGQYYSQQFNVSGGVPPYTFTINSGALPAGLNLSSSGLLYGTPQYAYAANFGVRVTDNQGRSGITPFTINGSGTGGGVLGTSTYKNGQLIKEGNTVYIVYRNTKSDFANSGAFTGFGFKFANVVDVGSSGLPGSGYTISTSNTSHPWGAWIKSGQTVYFVHEQGLVPVPDWNTFLNNNGQANLIVNANLQDFQLQMLSPMVGSDSRLY